MAIVRVPKVNNYTIMSNHHLIDPGLSFKAKGLMSYMLSRPDNWDFTIEGLAHQNKEGADAIARIIRELAERGYISRCRVRNQAGKFTDMEYKILECPAKAAEKEEQQAPDSSEPIPDSPLPNHPHPENPGEDSPPPVSPFPDSTGQIITESPKTEKRNTDLSNPDPSKTDLSIPERACEESPWRQDIRTLTAGVRLSIGYYELREQHSQDELDNIVSLIVEVLSARCDTFTLSGRKIPADLVKSRFQALNSHHIQYIFDCMKKSGSDIRNIKQYLLTSLFNAPATLESYYRAKVNHDFGP